MIFWRLTGLDFSVAIGDSSPVAALKTTKREWLGDLVKATSRSFYRALGVLPADVRPQIGLAYLLARTTDTIADTERVPVALRQHALQLLRERILGLREEPGNFSELMRHQE